MFPDKPKTPYRWRLNPTLLQRTDFCTFIKDQIKLFCETNCASSPDSFILWDTLKAYLRGQIISYTKGLKKQHIEDTDKLQKEILFLEKDYQRNGSSDTYQSLVQKNLQYNTLDTYKIKRAILRTRQRYYELGENAHKILSWQLKAEVNARSINAIQTETDSV